MTKPLTTLILDELEARLNNIKTANGYRRTVAGVRRATMTGLQGFDLPFVNFWSGVREQVASGHGWREWRWAIYVEVYDLARDRPFIDVASEIDDDVQIAIHRASTAPLVTDRPEQSMGGMLTSLIMQTSTPQIGEGQDPWCGSLITLSAQFKTRNDGVTLFALP